MAKNTVGNAKDESSMTDLQFTAYVELRDKYESLQRELIEIRLGSTLQTEDAVSDYQFQQYEQARNRCEELSNELAILRKENTKLKLQMEMLKAGIRINR